MKYFNVPSVISHKLITSLLCVQNVLIQQIISILLLYGYIQELTCLPGGPHTHKRDNIYTFKKSSENVLVDFFFILKATFNRYKILGWQFFSFNTGKMLRYFLLASPISDEKSSLLWIGKLILCHLLQNFFLCLQFLKVWLLCVFIQILQNLIQILELSNIIFLTTFSTSSYFSSPGIPMTWILDYLL